MPLTVPIQRVFDSQPGYLKPDDRPAKSVVPPVTSFLLDRLAAALDAQRVPYCQWKGQWSAHRWATGRGDVDLLVDRRAITAFRSVAGQLGFKLASPPGKRLIPGIESYFGHDPAVCRLLHLHVHYRLVLGDYWKTTHHIPIEQPMLGTAVPGSVFRVPAPTCQFLIFVLRMVLRQRGRPLLSLRTRWLTGIQIQLASLEGCSDRAELSALLGRYLPSIDLKFFDRCVRSLHGDCGWIQRAMVPWQLHRRLRAHARPPLFTGVISAGIEKVFPPSVARRFVNGRVRLAGGGTVVALVGGDGSGKSTCARGLEQWLSTGLVTMGAQMGNPPRSLFTFAVGAALKVEWAIKRMTGRTATGASPLELLRHLCSARDRYRLYHKIQRCVADGGIAVCERYPISEIPSHVGPGIAALLPDSPGPFGRLLARMENWYYQRMQRPAMLIVLRLDPELAVVRKPDEPADYVRIRGRTVWETDWTACGAEVVDAIRPASEVLDDIKARVWRAL
jgi:thymidylate kinase